MAVNIRVPESHGNLVFVAVPDDINVKKDMIFGSNREPESQESLTEREEKTGAESRAGNSGE